MNRRAAAPRLLAVLATAAVLAGCGDGGGGGTSSAAPTSAAPSSGSSSAPASAASCQSQAPTTAAPAGVSTDLSVEPAAPCWTAAPPTDLVVSDVVVGTGAEAVAGSTAAVRYVGAIYGTGQVFDSSWSRGAGSTLPVTVGAGQVIEGFDRAVQGMEVGGRRVVTIPSDLGYGPQGNGPIPGGATLVFVLDLVSVSS